ncbi:ParA family protein [Thermodesulfobacteriota bacterium]
MGSIVCIASPKGGVGKTTTAINLSAALAISEKKTLLVDCDPMFHATTGMGIYDSKCSKTLYDVIMGYASVEESTVKSALPLLRTLPSCIELFSAELELRSWPKNEGRLRHLLKELKDEYDYIIIDSPPSLSLLAVNAISAADYLVIPLQCDFYALESLSPLFKTVKTLRKKADDEPKVGGVLLTMYDSGEQLARRIAEDTRKYLKDMVFQTVIPRNIQLRESCTHGKPVMLQDITSIGSQSYLKLAGEVIEREWKN